MPHERAAVLAAIKAKLFEWPPDGQPALTAAPRDGARIERPGRENGSAGAELENMRGLEEDVARAQYFCLRTCCIHYFEHSRVRFDERRGFCGSKRANPTSQPLHTTHQARNPLPLRPSDPGSPLVSCTRIDTQNAN